MKDSIKKSWWLIFLCLPMVSYAFDMKNVRDTRYCEIILAKVGLTFPIYSTLNLNQCPEIVWSKITQENLKKETGATRVIMNGPRYLVMDKITNVHLMNPKPRKMVDLEVHEMSLLHLNLKDLILGFKPYREHRLERDITWIYDAGKPIYELVSPEGRVYVMQSYSLQEKPLKLSDLSNLGSQLKLLPGWRFKTGSLKNNAEISSINHRTVVIQDEFKNTYQYTTSDPLA